MAVSDRRYSTARWQKLRRLVLDRDGHICRIQGPRCRGYANTVHHIRPSSQHPELFWDSANLEAACGPCNYAGGSYTKAENQRTSREQIAYLERVVEVLEGRIDELAAALARERLAAANGPAEPNGRKRANPAIR
jgi:5-methylcytosine-specific restriction endonuclease McrA